MADENKKVSQDQEQAVPETADVPTSEERIFETSVSEDNAEPVQETAERTDADQSMQAPEEPVRASETVPVQENAPVPESPVFEEMAHLTDGEREIDHVIGVLLGETGETEPEEDRGQRTEDGEETAGEAQTTEQAQETPEASQTQEATQLQEQAPTVESVLEAILFATDEPLTDSKLAGIVETTAKQVRESIESLNARYAASNHAFRIEQIAGGYQMLTLNTYNHWLKKMLRVRSDNKLSPAAMETLAIIAYKQPIIRADIEAIRGVAVGEVIRSLMYKGLVKITGRAEILGRPMLYGTTKKFLEVFGLNSLKDLPKAEDLKNPDRG